MCWFCIAPLVFHLGCTFFIFPPLFSYYWFRYRLNVVITVVPNRKYYLYRPTSTHHKNLSMSLKFLLSHSKSYKVARDYTDEYKTCVWVSPFIRCKYVSIVYRYWYIQRRMLAWPWNLGQRSLKVIENGTIRKLGYGFLFAFHSNYSSIRLLLSTRSFTC